MKHIKLVLIVSVLMLLGGDSQAAAKKAKNKKNQTPEPVKLDRTIGDLAEVVSFNPMPVKGIGLVVGLAGTGSSECPPQMRDYLRKYIIAQVGRKDIVNPDMMINSTDTAVVLVEGLLPPGASKYQAFDISVKALSGTQTTSLAGGRLYTTELKFVVRVEDTMESSKALALAAGPVFIDNLSGTNNDFRNGIVLGGGKVMQDYQITLAMYKPDFRAAAYTRNRINQRFGRDVANAASESVIQISVPAMYRDKKERFIELIKSLYIAAAPVNEDLRISQLIENLQTAADKNKYQTAIEAMGRPAAEKLLPLLDSKNDQVKLAAAICLLSFGDERGLKTLRDFAQDTGSAFRIAAIQAVGDYASKNDTTSLMNRVVGDNNIDVRYNAYKYLQRYNDTSVIRTAVSEDYYIDQVIVTGPKTIYVSRKQRPGIVLFGAPIDCEKGIYIESTDGRIIINSQPADERVSIMRKHPITGELMGPLKCSTRIADIIKLLGDQASPKDDKTRPGLGVSYSDIIILLKSMVDKGAVKANFVAGPSSSIAGK